MSDHPVIVAVCGKGGVGKTSISAMLTILLAENRANKVLAIDADPAVGLSMPLGINVHKTVDDIRSDVIRSLRKNESSGKEELLKRVDYEIFEALAEKDNLGFLAIGRPEGDGCYCRVNSLLREIIQDVARKFDYVIIDGEAGIEQINRRVMEMVTHLFLVSDASLKGRKVARTIDQVAREKIAFEKSGIFFNRMENKEEAMMLEEQESLPVIGWMQENSLIKQFDRDGSSFFSLPDASVRQAVNQAIQGFIV